MLIVAYGAKKTNKLTVGHKWSLLTDILIIIIFNVSWVYYKISICDMRAFLIIIEVHKLVMK